MKNIFMLFALIALGFAAGCVQLEQDLTLKADGSGVVQVAYAAPEGEQTMMQQAAQAMLPCVRLRLAAMCGALA